MSSKRRKSQPYQIQGVNALLGELNGADSSVQSLPVNQITLPQSQPRRYFDPGSMEDLIESISQHGILQPLLVRQLTTNSYELVAGERRLRAAHAIQLDVVPVFVKQLTEEDAKQVALLENLQREDLNPIEETEGILELLSLKLGVDSEVIISLLNKAAHPDRNSVDNVIHTDGWEDIQKIFKSIGRFTPESFRTNRLPLLNLPDDILDYLRQGNIAYTKARAISRVKDEALRVELLKTAISNNLSLNEIKHKIKELEQSISNREKRQAEKFTKRLSEVSKLLKQVSIWKNPQRRKKAESLLKALEELAKE
ncbi:ParB/RepB/Spo0J family partition protein [Acaryochloris sp. IP29b_bin.137]|uniref:ParB/RepB/Spo0J family partition protein n=1 Tax=Acaryochloris sp. IP29b_bin.137 TaxID=2969217 RepID=UPI00262869CE|nr:ParB/RepB/Spo0J family partition protein [Acaryochloris sp. IP29b_bin.137]